jgi:hypothetical protein
VSVADSDTDVRLRMNGVLRRTALLGVTSVVGGILVGGVGGRIVMRVSALAAGPGMVGRVTENGNRIGEITFGGTLALVIFAGALGGVLASVVVVGSEPWLRWMGPLRGVGMGLVVLAVFGDFTTFDFVVIEPTALNVAMFVGLALVFGLAIQFGFRLLDRRLPRATGQEQVGYLVVDAAGGLALGFNVLFFTSSDFCGCEPALWMGGLILLLLASTAVRYASTVIGAMPSAVRVATPFAGYGSLAVILVVGLGRVVTEIQRLH